MEPKAKFVKKRRTREHIIADLSVNYVEKIALLCGYSVERFEKDYGYDLSIYTYDDNGEFENGLIWIQLKATDSLKLLADGQTIPFSVDHSHLEAWLEEPYPVILILYDAQAQVGYWVHIQAYFNALPGFNLEKVGKEITVHFKKSNIVDTTSIKAAAQYKAKILEQFKEAIRHEAK
ncbi:MAG TPA: DUF4365 domain-containing protein [Bacillota bacterium]|nr:DUF4365 domain-containing protein [Bacillota bacterium]